MSVKADALEKIIERVSGLLSKPASELGEATTFESLGMKSVNFSQLITTLEDAFDTEIPFMDFRRKKTLGEAAQYVEQLVEG